ncbi:TetR/AcrR family transcriptional regulator [Kineosporia babensis]|uniref:TetR/AcrR family transcriptional regulator n=1 Tax=Kineosporia babensis TaxID=499548 RepID=A0A9X1NA97_9ACTN|nr:TetR/AcrR family transcriptional regulator [Kineosporia babensis]MCD5310111.1 TetR/AcrR family transcriptional regulator [Kineosporia babensis]
MTTPTAKPAGPSRVGRKRDHSRDPEILEAALDVLAEVGYEGMTVDMVATRAKAGKATLYRRWPSKAELVIDAIACMKQHPGPGQGQVFLPPDTGTLRGDLVAMVKPKAVSDSNRHLRIMLGVASMISAHPELLEAINDIMLRPRASAYQTVFQRAIERGEIEDGVDVELMSSLGPAMGMFRALYHQKAPSRESMLRLIDHVILPAVGLSAPVESAHE